MFRLPAPADSAGSPSGDLVGRLRVLVVDGVLSGRDTWAVGDITTALGVGEEDAWVVLRELGRDCFLQRIDDETVRVRAASEVPADEVVQIRTLLEPLAARVAASRARAVDRIALQELAGAVASAFDEHDAGAYRRADDAFWSALFSLHPNAELGRLLGDLRLRTATDGLGVMVETGQRCRAQMVHDAVVAAVADGDVAEVERLSAQAMSTLRFVGAPRMDRPYLPGIIRPPLQDEVDAEFLEPDA